MIREIDGGMGMVVERGGVGAYFDLREGVAGQTDRAAIREVWDEDVYRLDGMSLAGATVVDIGAHIGSFAIRCALMGAVVHAYEPDSMNQAILGNNVRRNCLEGTVWCHDEAIDETTGDMELGPMGETGMLSIATSVGARYPTLSLPDLCKRDAENGGMILKIDTEGAEYRITAGAINYLYLFDRVMIETHPTAPGPLGGLLAKLMDSHHVEAFGPAGRGGMVYASRNPT